MDMIQRTLTNTINTYIKSGFINLIYGPRRVGKTTLLHQLADLLKQPGVWFDGDHQEVRNALSQTSPVILGNLVKQSQIVFIDEAQRIPNIGLSLKILVDTFPQKTFFVTGSSSLLLSRGIREPLTGRNMTYRLYPLSTSEMTVSLADYQKISLLENQLLYGGYPYLLQLPTPSEKQAYLKSVVDDYLFKDIAYLQTIEQPDNLRKLVTLLSFQLGAEVSYNELANGLHLDVKTIIRYLSLLTQAFIIFEVGSYAKNLRKEVAKSKKYYFWDLGIRNAAIDQFHPLEVRPDRGAIWENFLAVERLKKHEYQKQSVNYFFWRTYDQAEIDWLEEKGGVLSPFEFKLSHKHVRTPKTFSEAYKKEIKVISRDNYLDFVR